VPVSEFPSRNGVIATLADADPIELGQIDHANGIIYLANQAPETMLHELLHAVTATVTFDFYENPKKLSEEQTAAVQNLENMMTQFLGMYFSNESANAAMVAEKLQDTILEYLADEGSVGKAAALQECIAWSLTNQNLADTLKTTKVRTPLMRLVHSALAGLPHGQSLQHPVEHGGRWQAGCHHATPPAADRVAEIPSQGGLAPW
jgi:hypothetical protein